MANTLEDSLNMGCMYTGIRYLPKMRRVEVVLVVFALFSAIHLYEPSISFVTFGRSR